MHEPEASSELVQPWVVKAENDLRTAVHTLTLGQEAPPDTICFHAQQCIEKYFKAVLVLRGISFPKTHDLHTLMTLLPLDCRPTLDEVYQERLTEYATVARYPDEIADPSLAEARKAVATARRVRKEVRCLLPRAALRRKRKP
ncbi:MAG: HEPN domain-containing protein [Gemmataceae bacterium]|nr:HEPN domain-containing protein [Gemmataceae bacterium]